jgi:hypothetical protein
MYGIYLWQNNIHHKVWKNHIYTSESRLGVELLNDFFTMYDIDIHQLNIR